MSKTIYYVASTLDGFIADDQHGLDWLLQFPFEGFQAHYDQFMSGIGAIVMGSATYEFVLREGAWTYEQPTWVLTSRELPTFPGEDIRFTSESIPELHARLVEAAGGKDVWVVGGGNVAAQFANLGLLNELHLGLMPIVLGSGKPLLPIAQVTPPLELLKTTHFDGGAVELRYRLS